MIRRWWRHRSSEPVTPRLSQQELHRIASELAALDELVDPDPRFWSEDGRDCWWQQQPNDDQH